MERPRGLEPPPTAWQAVVLPLYYGRFAQSFYSMAARRRQAAVAWRNTPPHGSAVAARAGISAGAELTRSEARGPSSPPATSSAGRQTLKPWCGRCKPGRTSPRPCRRPSLASGGACGAYPCQTGFSFSFSQCASHGDIKRWGRCAICQFNRRSASTKLGSTAEGTRVVFNGPANGSWPPPAPNQGRPSG